jgi:acetolactate synthase-1/2/3 large subunit
MHDCDVMVCIGARFDDRITGITSRFSPNSKKIHVDIDPSSINKNIAVDVPIVGDALPTLRAMLDTWNRRDNEPAKNERTASWWSQIEEWRGRNSLAFRNSATIIKPQYAIQRLYELTKDQDVYITTDVGQHQMWAAQHFKFEQPLRWMTSGGLGTMGYGLPAAIGVQIAHPDSLVVCVSGDASWLMNMQEMSTAIQYRLPVKSFILNNSYMGMVRQWQEFFHGNRYAESYNDSLPDFVKLAEAFGAVGLRCSDPNDVDDVIREMLEVDKPVIVDCITDRTENVYPMIPGGAAHNEIQLAPDDDWGPVKGSEDGMVLV